MIQKFSRGDVYYCDLGKIKFNSNVEGKVRPCVIISNNTGNSTGNTLLVAPITTRSNKGLYPCQVYFYNGKDQVVLCEQLRVVDKSDVSTYVGKLDSTIMSKIDMALKVELDLPISETERYIDGIANSILSKVNKQIEIKIEEMCKSMLLKINEDYTNVNSQLTSMYEVFNKNQRIINNILRSMTEAYKDFNNDKVNHDKENNDAKLINDSKKSISIDLNNNGDDKEYLIQMVKDYYVLKPDEFIKKYNLDDNKQRSNKKTAACAKLSKKYNFNYKTIEEYKSSLNTKKIGIIDYNNIDECIKFIDLTSDRHGIEEACKLYNLSRASIYNFRAKCRKVLAEKNIYI